MPSESTAQNTTPRTRPSTAGALAIPPLRHWRTLDLVTAALLAVVTGVVFWSWGFVWTGLSGPLQAVVAPLSGILGGTWLLAGVLGGLVIRRPGAALFAEMLAATVSALLPGNQWGWTTLLSGLVQGLGVELVFAVFLYRRFGAVVAVVAGAMAGVFAAAYEGLTYYQSWSWDFKVLYLVMFALSGAVLAGLGGWLVTRALARAGALNALPPGREAAERRAV